MNKFTIQRNIKDSKKTLLERMIKHDPSFKVILSEDNIISYINILNENINVRVFNEISKTLAEHNKLCGNIKEDERRIRGLIYILENEEEFDPFAHVDYMEDEDLIDEKEDCVLSFSKGNSKISHPYLSLPEGYTCPMAGICQSFVKRDGSNWESNNSKIKDSGLMRCYKSTESARLPHIRERNWRNFDLIKKFIGDVDGMANLIIKSLKWHEQNVGSFKVFRISEGGDFFSQEYFDAWIKVAQEMPDKIFYTYTTSIPFWVARLGQIPSNMRLTASRDDISKKGQAMAELIDKYDLKYRVIVDTPEEAKKLRLPIDIDDSLALDPNVKKFALLIHGTQPKESGRTAQARKNSELLKKLNKK